MCRRIAQHPLRRSWSSSLIAAWPISAALDFRHTGTQTWDIELATDQGPIKLSAGGGQLTVGTNAVPPDPGSLASEYERHL